MKPEDENNGYDAGLIDYLLALTIVVCILVVVFKIL